MAAYMNLDDILKNGEMVFVRNNSNPLSKICIMINSSSGEPEVSIIPPHRYPVNLSERFPADAIYQSSDLRNQLGKEILLLVDPKKAREELADPKVVSYLRKRFASSYALTSPALSKEAEAMAKVMHEVNEQKEASELTADEWEARSNSINPRLVGLVDSLGAESPADPVDVLFDLKSMEQNLSESEIMFVLSKTKDHQDITDWAAEALQKINPLAYQQYKARVQGY